MLPTEEVCERARMARDPRFDGRFVVGVLTTGIYCRPICPARIPAEENVRYYATPAAAQDAGYRPCLRCRPENASRLPEWTLASDTVVRGLRYIEAGYLNTHRVGELAHVIGGSERQLNRVFNGELGATPASLARAQRVELAKRLIDHSGMPLADVAMEAGYGSVRRFNDEMKAIFGCVTSALRRSRLHRGWAGVCVTLPVRAPYNADWVFDFLDKRALAGVEVVEGLTYRRKVAAAENESAWITVSWEGDALKLCVPAGVVESMSRVMTRVRRVFDLGADSSVIDAHLAEDPLLAPWVARAGGLRVPGAWDGFETGVRAILGQQVSVARATDLANKLIGAYGEFGLFPVPEVLADSNPAEIGMPGRRSNAISLLARSVRDGELQLDECADPDVLHGNLCDIDGIGPWTASYMCLRVARDPNAFPESDWVVLKMLEATPAQARRLAQDWAPWRGYALMYLWFRAGMERQRSAGKRSS